MRLFRFILLAIFFSFNNTNACTCVSGITLQFSYYNADVVAHAIIFDVKDLSERTMISDSEEIIALKSVEYRAVVLQQYKGAKLADTIMINPGPGNCEMLFNVGEEYLIFTTSSSNNIYYTSMCKGNRRYNKKDHKTLLKLERINSK